MNEREYLARVAAAGPAELREIVTRADASERRVLEIYLGSEQLQEIEALAQRGATRDASRGNVVVLPGIMGSELAHVQPSDQDLLWVNLFRLIGGAFRRLGLHPDGSTIADIRATGMYQRFYGAQQVSLAAEGWDVRPFYYDWRIDLRQEADRLADCIRRWFPNQPVHLVAHSMGGLISRAMIARHPDLWKSMADPAGLKRGGRLVMLGTPNYGSFGSVQFLFGKNDVLSLVDKLDLRAGLGELLGVAKSFLSVYHMLPALSREVSDRRLFDVRTYTRTSVESVRLEDAQRFHDEIAGVTDPSRLVYVAGYNQRTPNRISDWKELHSADGYDYTLLGDGTVPHNLGLIDGVPTFFHPEEHQKLPNNREVRRAMTSILETGSPQPGSLLTRDMQLATREAADPTGLRASDQAATAQKEAQVETIRAALAVRGETQNGGDATSPEEQHVADLMLLLNPPPPALPSMASADPFAEIEKEQREAVQEARPRVRINLFEGSLEDVPLLVGDDPTPVDVVAVGHYAGLEPYGAFLALDERLSEEWGANHFLSAARQRKIFSTEQCAISYLPDPRAGREDAVVALVGMGEREKFGFPELASTIRELLWSAAQIRKKHVVSVLIGRRSVSNTESVHGWFVGLSRALVSAGGKGITSLTFVVRTSHDEVAAAIFREKEAIARFAKVDLDVSSIRLKNPAKASPVRVERIVPPTRISIEFDGSRFSFSAIGSEASIPVSEYRLSPQRIEDLSARILSLHSRVPITTDEARRIQDERYAIGRFLLSFLFPREFQAELVGSAPILLSLNNAAARIHWELAAQAVLEDGSGLQENDRYLALARGLSRQLSTVFASGAGPTSTASRRNVLRVLIVADPSKEQPLANAAKEGRAVEELFQQFNAREQQAGSPRRIECVSLIGPSQANSLDFLMALQQTERFDVLHYAGHCFYTAADPASSGFIFSRGGKPDIVTADDLQRIGRVPRFVFANACESGVLPSRLDRAHSGLAASFAEAFFARGVANFVCTAWPVLDKPAIDFAGVLYENLLGLQTGFAEPMWRAMREARRAIRTTPSWAAYQHYGDPNFRLLADRTS